MTTRGAAAGATIGAGAPYDGPVYHEGQARGLPIGILNAPEDLHEDDHEDDHLNERGYFVCVEQPGFGPVPRPVAAYRFSDLDVVARQPAARLGEHTAAVLGGAP